jgi:FAD/FMN-containing dehydrogenase
VTELQDIVCRSANAGTAMSVCGGRHAMGGQQFGSGTALIDMTSLDRVLDVDAERGLVTVETGT